MALHIWGRLSSINVRKVVWAAQELGLEFTRTDAGLSYGITKTPEYRAKNPNALVPLIDDEGFQLWESNVIVRYLCAKHSAGAMYSTDLRERFDAERWMDWQQTTFNSAGRDAFIQLVRTAPEARKPEAVRASVAATAVVMAMLDAQLARHAWVTGERLGMADIPLGCEMHRWWGIPDAAFEALGAPREPLGTWPNVERWWAAIQTRPAIRGVLDQPLA